MGRYKDAVSVNHFDPNDCATLRKEDVGGLNAGLSVLWFINSKASFSIMKNIMLHANG